MINPICTPQVNPTLFQAKCIRPKVQNKNLAKLRKQIKKTDKKDSFEKSSHAVIIMDKDGWLERILYEKPIPLLTAISDIKQSSDPFIKHNFTYGISDAQELCNEIENSELKNCLIKSIYGLGASAIVFDIGDDKLLKISNKNHFPEDRPVADFDAPIYKTGRLKNYYYYITQKLSQENIKQEEIHELCQYITMRNYKLFDVKDYLSREYSIRQFGKDYNGKLFLLDPECAIEGLKRKNNHLLFKKEKGKERSILKDLQMILLNLFKCR